MEGVEVICRREASSEPVSMRANEGNEPERSAGDMKESALWIIYL